MTVPQCSTVQEQVCNTGQTRSHTTSDYVINVLKFKYASFNHVSSAASMFDFHFKLD